MSGASSIIIKTEIHIILLMLLPFLKVEGESSTHGSTSVHIKQSLRLLLLLTLKVTVPLWYIDAFYSM